MGGLEPSDWGVDQDILDTHYLLAIAYLDLKCREELEARFIRPIFDIAAVHQVAPVEDYSTIPGIDVEPPAVVIYFVRPSVAALADFIARTGLEEADETGTLDELVYQNSFALNVEFYAAERGNQAFVLSHAKDLLVLKMVGYAEDVITYYRLEKKTAHVWIGHHRYPTKGRVWHPGGAHPFIGLNEALVHNGDFANYQSICDYLAQRDIRPLFMTDTEVSALVYDLHRRTYRYPLEYVIESLAPTTEIDFELLGADKQEIYTAIQRTHIHGSPDGPWFFIIAENIGGTHRLIGITDTSMLRPQVFAVQRGEVSIAFCASEKQVIDAVLEELAAEDPRFWSLADHYWVARGGSHTDGGAFSFTLQQNVDGRELLIADKFGRPVEHDLPGNPYFGSPDIAGSGWNPETGFTGLLKGLSRWDGSQALACLEELELMGTKPEQRAFAIHLLISLRDRIYPLRIRRSAWQSRLDIVLNRVFASIEHLPCAAFVKQRTPGHLPSPASGEQSLIIDARPYPIEGDDSVALELVRAYRAGWRRLAVINCRGHRFIGCGFGTLAEPLRIDVFGSPGDYLMSGTDGVSITVHGDGQDQMSQIMKSGTLVVHGSVGQAFGYGAKGGHAYIRDDAAGRPMINAVGKPRILINGTCLDYLAESFMAGDPLDGGGFVIINGIRFSEHGTIEDLPTPYPGGNLFSLASGGAIYIRDPRHMVGSGQLNGGEWDAMRIEDWSLIRPYLERNAELFGITIERLLTVDGVLRPFNEVYRKARPAKTKALQAEEAWVAHA